MTTNRPHLRLVAPPAHVFRRPRPRPPAPAALGALMTGVAGGLALGALVTVPTAPGVALGTLATALAAAVIALGALARARALVVRERRRRARRAARAAAAAARPARVLPRPARRHRDAPLRRAA